MHKETTLRPLLDNLSHKKTLDPYKNCHSIFYTCVHVSDVHTVITFEYHPIFLLSSQHYMTQICFDGKDSTLLRKLLSDVPKDVYSYK